MPLDVKARSFGSMKASQSMHQFPAKVVPLQKSSGGLNWCPSIHPSTTEKISISLRPGLGLRSPIVERNNLPQDKNMLMSKFTEIWLSSFQLQF